MKTAKIFYNGRSQAVHLPKDCRFDEPDVYIKKLGNIVILFPKNDPWASFFTSLDMFSDDFMTSGNQPPQQSKEEI